MSKKTVFVLGVLVFLQTMVAAGDTASFQGLGDLPGGYFSSSAYGVSADGLVVVGRSKSSSGTESFRWVANDGIVGLGDLDGGSFFGGSTGASADGAVVVGFSKSSPGYDDNKGEEAFRWTEADGMVGLGTLGGDHLWSCAYGVNADGSVVVGWSGLEYGVEGREAFRWTTDGGMVGLGDLDGGKFYSWASDVSSDGSVVVGASKSASGEEAKEAFRWTVDDGMVGLGRLEGSSNAYAVSADGSVVVGASGTDSRQEAFRWTEENGIVGLGDLPGSGFWSTAFDVSADGSVVVGHSESASGVEAFIWDKNNGMRSLKDVLVNDYGLDLTGWTLMSARGISDDGRTIVGYGFHPDNLNTEAWVVRLPAPQVVYVDADAPAGGDGASWDTAVNYLQDALATVGSGDEILVAEGTYTPDVSLVNPTGTGDRQATFQLKNGVSVRGGYAGCGEPDPNARDIELYETILTGDMASDDEPNFTNNEENSYHVVTGSYTDKTAVLNGFTITAGNANGSFSGARGGGGMFNQSGSPTVTDCTFSGNYGSDGGGMNIRSSSPTVTNCTFRDNRAATLGGGMSSSGYQTVRGCKFIGNSATSGGGINVFVGDPLFENCVIRGNSASEDGGGIQFVTDNWARVIGCQISGNMAGRNGGGMYCSGCYEEDMIINCSISGNTAGNLGGGMYTTSDSSMNLFNCIFWGDTPDEIYVEPTNWPPTPYYCCIQGGWPGQTGAGSGGIIADPLFVDANGPDDIAGTEDDNLRLLPGSQCIDTGDPCYVPAPNETDLDGNPRIINGRIDMGAYESDYIKARLRLLPRTINRQSKMKRVMAWMQLPQSITKEQIDEDTPLLLYPGPLEPINKYIFEHGRKGRKRTSIFILYDKAELLSVVPDNGLVDVQVIGSLNTGQNFYGTSFLTLIDHQQPNQWRLLRKK